jgi:MoxR-like ATPase
MDILVKEDLQILQELTHNLEACILGKKQEIKLIVTALLADGHVLLEDVPGTGKTVLIKALAKSIHGEFRRIQCNPDLLPTDITGVSIYHPKNETFIFRPGPVLTNILLIDEINRATTKTQSALLEAMEERHVTVDGESHPLPKPFLLLATQNPIDFEGTYSLPEAQLDRFMLKFSLGYPDEVTELAMVSSQTQGHPLDSIKAVSDMDRILKLQQKVKEIHMDEAVSHYTVTLVRKTREHREVFLGASPRGTLALIHASKAYALLNGRDYVIPDDIKFLAPFVLGHRMILHSEARMEGSTIESVLESIFQQVRVPVRLEK